MSWFHFVCLMLFIAHLWYFPLIYRLCSALQIINSHYLSRVSTDVAAGSRTPDLQHARWHSTTDPKSLFDLYVISLYICLPQWIPFPVSKSKFLKSHQKVQMWSIVKYELLEIMPLFGICFMFHSYWNDQSCNHNFFTIGCVKITLEIIDIGISDAHHFQYFATCLSYTLMETWSFFVLI